MPSTNPTKALLMGMLASTATCIQSINAVWSTGDFSTISGPSGNLVGHFTGFNLIDGNGGNIYSNSAPNDKSPCQQADGYTFTLGGGCFAEGQTYSFHCVAAFDGSPESCDVLDSNGDSIGSGEGDTDTNFIGISISQSGYCGAVFSLNENVSYLPDLEGFTVS